jgi:hypothetical protein
MKYSAPQGPLGLSLQVYGLAVKFPERFYCATLSRHVCACFNLRRLTVSTHWRQLCGSCRGDDKTRVSVSRRKTEWSVFRKTTFFFVRNYHWRWNMVLSIWSRKLTCFKGLCCVCTQVSGSVVSSWPLCEFLTCVLWFFGIYILFLNFLRHQTMDKNQKYNSFMWNHVWSC